MTQNKITLYDGFDQVYNLQNRVDFITKLDKFFSEHHASSVYQVPKMAIISPQDQQAINLNYPVIIKREEGNVVANAHFFYICVNANAVLEALKSDQFTGAKRLLV